MGIVQQVGFALALGAGSVSAADLQVKVLDRITGLPVADAAVCLGTAANPSQFAGVRTDQDGVAAMRAPVWAHRLTVSGSGYDNINIEQPGRQYALVLELKAQPGRAAPDCRVKKTAVERGAGIAITSVDVIQSDLESGKVVLRTETAGHKPTHIRVAGRSDFAGSSWQALQNGRSVHYVRNMADGLFVQVRRRLGNDVNHIEAISDVVTEAL